jgi:hypothetical protein
MAMASIWLWLRHLPFAICHLPFAISHIGGVPLLINIHVRFIIYGNRGDDLEDYIQALGLQVCYQKVCKYITWRFRNYQFLHKYLFIVFFSD